VIAVVKAGYRLVDGAQIPTRPTTIAKIMAQPTFGVGVADARAGRPMHKDYDTWDVNDQWGYERGRQWARLAPRTVALKRNGKITLEAMRWYKQDIL
jgi:hypothetical protein